MSLAEEYFDAAHSLAPSVSVAMTATNVETYEKLISTGLSCLDTALKNVRLPPRVEANIRLRYAGVLYEETENFMEAEIALGKGIALCERNHYYDLKYAMKFLLAQLIFKNNPKASMKALDGHIADAQTYGHFSWVYAMRFLRASHSLASGSAGDFHAAIANYRAIADLANQESDRAIYMTASLLEGMAHLRSTGKESILQAQRAIAQVWTFQLDPDTRIPPLLGLAHILDVICSVLEEQPKVTVKKLDDMRTMFNEALKNGTWSRTNDAVAIPINRRENSSQVVSPDTRMILGIGDDGRDNLMLSFLSQSDAYTITNLLGGVVLLNKSSKAPSKNGEQKAIQFLDASLNLLQKDIQTCRATSGILPDLLAKLKWRGRVSCHVTIYMAFHAAAFGAWPEVKRKMDKLQSIAKELEVPLDGPLGYLTMYLSGVYHQGIGDLDTALQHFQDERFGLPPQSQPTVTSRSVQQVERDISLLAALNTIWILQDEKRKNPATSSAMITRLRPFCETHMNQDIKTAFNLIVATVETSPETSSIEAKNHLKRALSGAQVTTNTQFLCIALILMCKQFFSNIVGEQAEKSAMAASFQAKRSGNALWRSVAEGLLAQCYEVNGKKLKARDAAFSAQEATRELRMAQAVSDP